MTVNGINSDKHYNIGKIVGYLKLGNDNTVDERNSCFRTIILYAFLSDRLVGIYAILDPLS